ncbi:hypothetical protein LSAT2_009135 [Lamellibrachia satsuma]|nr:hypothetical protein LSAT2_009135 [Lamellibrachia satsuma]
MIRCATRLIVRRWDLLLFLLTTALLLMVVAKYNTTGDLDEMDYYVYSFGRGNEPLRRGRALRVNRSFIRSLGLPPRRFARLSESTLNDFVVVTAASASHFVETYDAVASIQTHLPGKRIFFYDLGLEDSQVEKVKRWCKVTYRKFDFKKYPDHVVDLKIYAWKPLIIQDILRDYDTILWMDSSFRLFEPHLRPAISMALENRYGAVLFTKAGGSNFMRTHEGTFSFLPTDVEQQRHTSMAGATTMLLSNTRRTYERVLRWFYLCALEESCIAPIRKRHCNSAWGEEDEFLDCHRFDQSVINILLSNVINFAATKYHVDPHFETFFNCTRHPTKWYKLRICD